ESASCRGNQRVRPMRPHSRFGLVMPLPTSHLGPYLIPVRRHSHQRGTPMAKRSGAVTFKGGPITLVGPQIKAGDKAPAFKTLKELDAATLADTPAEARHFTSVPALAT